MELAKLDTEKRNPRSMQIDTLSTLDMVELINAEDHLCAEAVKKELPLIAQSIDIIYEQLRKGGRLFYCGAGTSGRLGVLDAAECPPTFGVSSDLVIGLIAGGDTALKNAVEGAEDSTLAGEADLKAHEFSTKDVLVGIAASGRTPYVIGAMKYAHSTGAPVVALVCCNNSEMSAYADVTIAPLPGPEVITGSSRMKSGTCQKMVLNMISTGAMVKSGKVFGNLMVDVKASNEKLVNRAASIVCTATGEKEDVVRAALEKCDYHCKTAIVMLNLDIDADCAKKLLDASEGRISAAIKKHKGEE
ncbi:MAG: N-acetylmuramic acid 6-phosphate etherase [Clostridia bacterium]|nr:N-acetylmuramic acid 6-phosphate etherase [Clostridia bacterium]